MWTPGRHRNAIPTPRIPKEELFQKITEYGGSVEKGKERAPEPGLLLSTLVKLFEQYEHSKEQSIDLLNRTSDWIVRTYDAPVIQEFSLRPAKNPDVDALQDIGLVGIKLREIAKQVKNWPDAIKRVSALKEKYGNAVTHRYHAVKKR